MGRRGSGRRGEKSFNNISDNEKVVGKKSTKPFRGRKVTKRACQVEEMRSTEKLRRRIKRH